MDDDPRLIPGVTASCTFFVGTSEDTLLLPRRAVKGSPQGTTARIMVDGEMQERPVEVGLKGDENTEILGGLGEGDEVVMPRLGAQKSPMGENRMREMGRRIGGGGFSASKR